MMRACLLILAVLCGATHTSTLVAQNDSVSPRSSPARLLERARQAAGASGDILGAEEYYQTATEHEDATKDQLAEAYLGLARARQQLGMADDADQALRQAARLTGPAAEEAQRLLAGEGLEEERLRAHVTGLLRSVKQYGDGWDQSLSDLIWVGDAAVPQITAALEAELTDTDFVKHLVRVLVSIESDTVVRYADEVFRGKDAFLKGVFLETMGPFGAARDELVRTTIPVLGDFPVGRRSAAFDPLARALTPEELLGWWDDADPGVASKARRELLERPLASIPDSAANRVLAVYRDAPDLGIEEKHRRSAAAWFIERGEEDVLLAEMRRAEGRTAETFCEITSGALLDRGVRAGVLIDELLRNPATSSSRRRQLIISAIEAGVDISAVLDESYRLGVRSSTSGRRVRVRSNGMGVELERVVDWLLGLGNPDDTDRPHGYDDAGLDAMLVATLQSSSPRLAKDWIDVQRYEEPRIAGIRVPEETLRKLAKMVPEHPHSWVQRVWIPYFLETIPIPDADREALFLRALADPELVELALNRAHRPPRPEELQPLLASDDWQLRYHATRALLHLQGLGSGEASASIRHLLDDENAMVRRTAVLAWSRLGGVHAVDDVLLLASDPDESVRSTVLDTIDDHSSELVYRTMVEMLLDPSPELREKAETSLARLEDYYERRGRYEELAGKPRQLRVPARHALEMQATDGSTKEIRLLAISSLGTLGDPEAFPFLISLVTNPDKEIQDAARGAVRDLQEILRHTRPERSEGN